MRRLREPLWSHYFDLPSGLDPDLVLAVWKALALRETLLAGIRTLWRLFPDGREFRNTYKDVLIPLSPADYCDPDKWLCVFQFEEGLEVLLPARDVVSSSHMLQVKFMLKFSAPCPDTKPYLEFVEFWRESLRTDAIRLQGQKLVVELPYSTR
jgi:hypothetical protein